MPVAMPSLPGFQVFRDEMSLFKVIGMALLFYYCVMDVILYITFMNTNLVESSKGASDDELYSPFTHLSVKQLMNDHTSQYIVSPAIEYFDIFTQFSGIFYFITPNMISFTHLAIAFLAGRFVASESLHSRRIGVILFEIRTCMDTLDGVVFRAHTHTKGMYQSVRNSSGYYVDITCDALGGVFLCFGVLFYLFKRFDPAKQVDLSWKSVEAGTSGAGKSGTNGLLHSGAQVTYSKKMLFWKCWCYGITIAMGGKFWDSIVSDFKDVFQIPIADPALSALQYETCHSGTTVFLWYLWRLVEGQALLQYLLVAIFIDKVWEFINFVQYILFVAVLLLYLVSLLYVHHVRTMLHL
ncbi:ceramide phosphoethanolamine synthase-like [Pomacea canaliculata]|uniref:ceramide phosphoethanolamine synthase-like n=1 Tax=Pomacea canaliculata TaxID=400727 RepID=UPI000D730967|nr:ceramide phosphoethanolamine synthase-like [Pomacea canaliculata]XP_025086302.1 ceramide phosphoethanolamine synthase-like [Pomacea canaliculata]XP_025086303.1 ceramide phosphoethanolamine synthase-like [Pomacea canaliculata]XP_025086304.1 ceramide phosphoethanolamine synthase-like [Pomacea canaliculata]XP_025086305.1 ceramide phosphoethanolamine synthase-like [Pomacea canaliculata]